MKPGGQEPWKIVEPFETLRPCRSRIIAGVCMIAVLAAAVFVLAE